MSRNMSGIFFPVNDIIDGKNCIFFGKSIRVNRKTIEDAKDFSEVIENLKIIKDLNVFPEQIDGAVSAEEHVQVLMYWDMETDELVYLIRVPYCCDTEIDEISH